MSASNQPITDTGKVLTLRGRKPVPSRSAEQGGSSEADVLPIGAVAKSAVEAAHAVLPASNHPAAVVLPNSQGGSNIPLDKTAEAAITELLSTVQAANSQAACLWLQAGDYSVIEGIHGHEVGLRLMERVEARLSKCLREDDLICRLTSNEFVIVLKDVGDRDTAGHVAERLLKRCNGVYRTAGVSFHLQCSAGVTLYPFDAADPYQLLRYARMALAELSPKGPSRYRLFSTQLLAGLRDRAWMSVELERALEQDRLVLHYQPEYAIDTQRVVAVEALVRLVTASGELIGPNEFIELAEQTGQILPLGRWVIEEACQQLGRWQRAGAGSIRMAVNVSPCQLMAEDFCALVDAAVLSAGIQHSDLELEITECQMVENLPYVEQTLRKLMAKGLRVAVDDFGTGYSSLAYLTQLSISRVKVDRAFVSRITDDMRAERMVHVLIDMARKLGLELTAEGIETEAQHRLLLESGCELGQGYGFAQPQSAEAIERFLF